jgi:3-deoxy-D-manno-octulosonic-acid transferase
VNRILYTLALYLLLPVVLFHLLRRGFRNQAYWARWGERFGYGPPIGTDKLIWIHAVSVGEARAAVPLVRRLFDRYPDHEVLITTMTPTGSATVTSLLGDRVRHCYVPYDYPGAVRRFLDRAQPKLALIMETELWPNLFHACRERGIQLLVANVRLSERSARRYSRFTGLTRSTLGQPSAFGVQNRTDADRLIALGADSAHTHVTGSIKFELALPASLLESADVLRREWGADRPVWLAASTHDGEDERLLIAHADLRRQARFANALLVLVPRHPERFAAVARLSRKLGFTTAQRSTTRGNLPATVAVLIGDTMGELQLFYAACDCAFIGGSLVPTGGHNLLEACVVGKPAVFGPHMFNFAEIAQLALERGAAVQVHDGAGLLGAIGDFLGNANRRDAAGEAGRKLVEENRGALEQTLAVIARVYPG